tara:strand:- start:36649 stop:36888 length:240 start_codon:yes stop_codon:yes gene_type:complete
MTTAANFPAPAAFAFDFLAADGTTFAAFSPVATFEEAEAAARSARRSGFDVGLIFSVDADGTRHDLTEYGLRLAAHWSR